jgi:glutamate--cysteine ligase
MTQRTDNGESSPIESRADLLSVFEGGEKAPADWRIGTEHEKFVFRVEDHRAPSYDEKGGIRDLLMGLTEFGWKPVIENGNVIALTGADGTISLEPAGQFELSGAPLENLHQTCAEAARHLGQCKMIGERLGLGFLGLGMWPDKTRAELPIMPKGRYAIMLRYMPTVGNLGLDMMLRTCTIQVNLDYSSEADMVKKFRVGLALQPVATALFANSPLTEGHPNGYKSFRSHIWEDTDPDRTGMLPFVFEDGFGYERYCDYMLGVPMYFVYRGGKYVDGASAISSTANCPSCPARSLRSPTGPITSRLHFRKCGSRAFLKCGEPTRAAGAAFAACRRSGSACSTTGRRSTRRGSWSSIGRSTNARGCAATYPNSRSMR